jgi:hypothetical protein
MEEYRWSEAPIAHCGNIHRSAILRKVFLDLSAIRPKRADAVRLYE